MLTRMDPTLAETLPALYRAILDRVAELEAGGRRTEAARMRSDATGIYSRAWDEKARRRLQALLDRHAHPAAGMAQGDPGLPRTREGHSRPGSAVIS
jgi:hypothetical protein